MKRVLIVMGGESQEREVSLRSGQAIYKALLDSDHEVLTLDLTRDSLIKVAELNPDVVFIALHGKKGEDGTVQGYLELMDIPYTGSDVAVSAICMNKIITKKIFAYEKIPTPDHLVLDKAFLRKPEPDIDLIIEKVGLPMVIKAPTQGSSIGTFIVRHREDIARAIKEAQEFNDEVLVEKFIEGIEVTASVIGNDTATVLPLIEITSVNEFFDYESKYTPGMCNHIIPARIDKKLEEKIKAVARKTYEAFGCRGFARIDFIVDKNAEPYVLEVNTIPGMTEMSLVPDAARAAGMSFKQLVEHIIELAFDR